MLLDCYEDYQPFLRDVLARRRAGNARYSLRAFARDLGISAPQLSGVMRGTKGLSPATATRVAARLKLGGTDQRRFQRLVEKSDARSASTRGAAARDLATSTHAAAFRELTLDGYRLIADWYHFAILELTEIPGVELAPEPIAALLGLDVATVTDAIDRLKRRGLLCRVPGSKTKWRKTDKHLTTSDGVASAAIRETTRQLLHKAEEALETQTVDERDVSTVTFAIDPKRLPEAKRVIAAFRRQMIALLEQEPRSELYCLAVQLFRLTTDAAPERIKS